MIAFYFASAGAHDPVVTTAEVTKMERIETGIVDAAWQALRAYLAGRCRELDDEVRHYPTPISRCDVQLTKLLEQRGRAWRQATLADAARAGGGYGWLQRSDDAPEDDAENALRAALRVALEIDGRLRPVEDSTIRGDVAAG